MTIALDEIHNRLNQLKPEKAGKVQNHLLEMDILQAKFDRDLSSISNIEIDAYISYYTGDHETALQLATQCENRSLTIDVLLAKGDWDHAFQFLAESEKSPYWHYSMGRYYGHKFDFDQSIFCLNKAIQGFSNEGNRIMSLNALANMGNYQYQAHDYHGAKKTFSTLLSKFYSINFSNFKHIKANILINYGSYHLNMGDLKSAIKSFVKAKYILKNSTKSNSYLRVTMQLAFLYSELGKFNKSNDILSSNNFVRDHINMDRFRLMAVNYSKIGFHCEAINSIRKAKSYACEADPYAKFYLPTYEYLVLQNSGETHAAKVVLDKVLTNTKNSNQLEAYFYALSIRDSIEFTHQSKSLEYHISNNFHSDITRDKINTCWNELILKQPENALDIVSQIPSKTPLISVQRDLILTISHYNLEQIALSKTHLKRAFDGVSLIDDLFLTSMTHYLTMQITENGPESLRRLKLVISKISSWQRAILFGLIEKVGVTPLGQHLLSVDGSRSQISSFDLSCLKAERGNTVIDLETKQIFTNSEEFNGLKKSPQSEKLFFYLAAREGDFTDKEAIILEFFKKREYSPQTDNNLIYVAINRLKKLLGGLFVIQCREGSYRVQVHSSTLLSHKQTNLMSSTFWGKSR